MSALGFDSTEALLFRKPDSLLLFKLRRQRWLIGCVAVPLFVCLAAGAQFLPPTYKSDSQVMVDARAARPAVRGSDAEVVQPFTDDIVGTELAVLGSEELIGTVVNKLKLYADPHYNPHLHPDRLSQWRAKATDFVWSVVPFERPQVDVSDEYQAWSDTVQSLSNSVDFTAIPRSRVIKITVASYDKSLAARIANLMADYYITRHTALTQEINVDANTFLTTRLSELQATATAAAQAVEDYRLKAGLSAGATSTLVQERISQLERQLLDAKARQGALQTEYDSVKNVNPEQLSLVLNNPTVTRLRELEAVANSKLSEFAGRYNSNSEMVAPYRRTLESIRRQIADEANRGVAGLKADLASANANVVVLMSQADDAKIQLGRGDGARAHLETLQAQSAAAYNLYAAFLNRSKETDASLLFPSTDVRVVSRAVVPTHPSFPRDKAVLPASAAISLLLAGALGLLVEQRRKGLVSSNEVGVLFDLPTLGIIPTMEPRYPIVYRDAIENLLNRIYFGLQAKSVLITSALPDEGKTSTAKALAEAAAARGLKVLLINGDLRTTVKDEQGSHHVGFAEVLRGEIEPGKAMQSLTDSPLVVMSSGVERNNPMRLLSLPGAQRMFKDLEQQFDLILIDAPPVMVGGDCWMLARHVDRTVLIVKWASTTEQEINLALKLLSTASDDDGRTPRSVSGIVLNMVDRSKSRKLDTTDSALFAPSVFRYYRQSS